jgi:hypothetical protein
LTQELSVSNISCYKRVIDMLPRSAAVNGGGKVPRGNRRNKKEKVWLCCHCQKQILAQKMQRHKSQCFMRPWLGDSLATRQGSDSLMEGQDRMGANKNRSGNNLKKDKDQDKDQDKQVDKDEDEDEYTDAGRYSLETDDDEDANSFWGKKGNKRTTKPMMIS